MPLSHFDPRNTTSSIRKFCLASKDIAKLQRVQICLTMVVTRSRFFSLSAANKIIALAPCALSHHFQKNYNSLSSTLIYTTSIFKFNARNSRQLRSTSSNPLYTPRVKTKAGTRAFSVAAPTVWNSLPASVKSEGNIVSFRRRLKPYLCNAAYPP